MEEYNTLLAIYIDSYVAQVDFRVMILYTTNVILGSLIKTLLYLLIGFTIQ